MAQRFTIVPSDTSFAPVLYDKSIRLAPTRFSHTALFGPKQCEIVATGTQTGLFQLLDWLRYGIVVHDEVGEPCWWGFIKEVSITVGPYTFGLSLDHMVNRVAVAYTEIVAGQEFSGARATTDWVTDSESIARFGIKEKLFTLSDAKPEQADRYRDALLQAGAMPQPIVGLSGSGGMSARLYCVGWQEILKWRTFQNAGEGTGYVYVLSDGESPVTTGLFAAVGQTFQVTGQFGCTVTNVSVRVQKYGAPSSNLTCELWTDSAGTPGALLVTRTLAPGAITYMMDWVAFDFTSANLTLTAGATYWIVLYGADGVFDCYAIGKSDTAGYGGGQGQEAPTVTWAPAAWDMFFKVDGIRDTTDVVRDIATTYGQGVFPSVVASAQANVIGSAYGDGDSTAYAVIEDNLVAGTSSAPRLLARIGPDRTISLNPEPIMPPSLNPQYQIDSRGRLFTTYGIPVDGWKCPTGGWAEVIGVIPANMHLSSLTALKYVFIEEAEYDVKSDRLSLTPRGQRSIFDLGGVA